MNRFENPNSRLNTSSTKWDRYLSRYQLDDVIPLWVADMDFMCPEAVEEAIISRAKHGIFGYTDVPLEALEATVQWEKRQHHIDIHQEDIIFTTGVVYAMYTAVELFVKEDEKIVVQTPVYPPFFNTPLSLNREIVYNSLIHDAEMNLTQLDEMLENDPKIKMLIFCNPHNPIGKAWSKKELYDLLTICEKHDILVMSDEIHADIVFSPHQHTSLLGVDERFNDRIILLGAPTKTFNLAGMKISYALILNKERNVAFAKAAKASGLSSINIFGYEALTAAYNHGDAWLKECLDYISQNMIYLKEFIAQNLPLCRFEIPESTYLAWVDFSAYNLPENFQEILKFEGKVELQDGRGFKDSDGYQRINVACPRATLEEGLNRIVNTMKKAGYIK